MDTATLKTLIKKELPHLLQEDLSLKEYVIRVTRGIYADKQTTEDLLWNMLDELRRNREEDRRKWAESKAEQDKKWAESKAEQDKKWEEQNRRWEEQNRKWAESKAEQDKKWEESKAEQDKKWEEQVRENKRIHAEIMALAKKHDRSIGALGARWGIQSERSFRNALAGILEENFGVEVVNIQDFDETGDVFGRPDQIELDIIIKNGLLLICELKSSMSKSDMYIFERKARFYEKRSQRKANSLLVISPMVDARAVEIAKKLGIKVYSDSSEVLSLQDF